jgi:hypothetical protein
MGLKNTTTIAIFILESFTWFIFPYLFRGMIMRKHQSAVRTFCDRSCQRLKWYLSALSIMLATGIVYILESGTL